MADRSEPPYDPYIPAGGAGGQKPMDGNQKTAALKAQIDNTVDVMRQNINKVSQRGENISQLQDRSEDIAGKAQHFRRGANAVRKQMWWKNVKMMAILAAGIIILILLIAIPLAVKK